MARLPPSRHAVHRRLRIPDLRAGDDSPLSNTFCPAALAACAFRRLPTQRIRHCGLNGTYQTRSRPCAKGSRSLSLEPFLDVHAANAASDILHRSRTPSPYLGICETVELDEMPVGRNSAGGGDQVGVCDSAIVPDRGRPVVVAPDDVAMTIAVEIGG